MPLLSLARSIILATLLLSAAFAMNGCTQDDPVPTGTYTGNVDSGTDTATSSAVGSGVGSGVGSAKDVQASDTIRVVLGITGGGIVSGTWVQGASMPFANINATKNFWGHRHYTLDSTEGPCKGSFELSLKEDGDRLSGDVTTSSGCALGKFAFHLKKTAPAIEPLTQ